MKISNSLIHTCLTGRGTSRTSCLSRSILTGARGRLSLLMWMVVVAFGASVGGCALTSCEDGVDESALGAAEADSLEQASEIADLPTLLPGSEWRMAHSWQRSGNTWLEEWNTETYCRFDADSMRCETMEIVLSLDAYGNTVRTCERTDCGTYPYSVSGATITIGSEAFRISPNEETDNTTLALTFESESWKVVLKKQSN